MAASWRASKMARRDRDKGITDLDGAPRAGKLLVSKPARSDARKRAVAGSTQAMCQRKISRSPGLGGRSARFVGSRLAKHESHMAPRRRRR
jgi:hypothetical protein